MKKYPSYIIIALILILALWRTTYESHREPKISGIKLVLFIVVDQFPYEYVERFLPHADRGLRRIFSSGFQFLNAHHDHGVTATCPGHAALVTGSHPKTNGIVGNGWYDREEKKEVYCVEDPTYEFSPRNLYVSTLSDWIKGRSSRSKVFSVSGKDRGAIPLAGNDGDAAFWFDNDELGQFVSSEYYPDNEPQWLQEYYEQAFVDSYFGSMWEPLPTSDAVRKKAGVEYLNQGDFPDVFPHQIGESRMAPDSKFYGSFSATPFLDDATTDFAKALLMNEDLGRGESLDFLGVSYSALDRVGHHYGPHSPEVFDTFLRLDQTVGDLLDVVDDTIGLDSVLVIFSADHGVQHYPEYLRNIKTFDGQTHRQNANDVACFQGVREVLQTIYGHDLFLADGYLDKELIKEHSLPLKAVEETVKETLEKCKMIEKVYSASDLSRCKNDEVCAQYARAYIKERSPDFFTQPKKNHLHWMIRGTGHGTPYPYDSHVPLVIAHPEVRKESFKELVSVTDAAPTVAELLGLSPPPTIDGRSHNILK